MGEGLGDFGYVFNFFQSRETESQTEALNAFEMHS